ncbi:family 10 glycosylhydrolase, partial [Oscillospiraceae bacterium OttesenSCG-928-G22]|nr:family 10 glycosylhydrolase [Oscillospiraceae bacterium OttesenSCG-928-G22]
MRVKRKLALLLAAVLFLPLVLGTGEAAAANDSAANGFVTADEEFRGMWVATVLNLDYPSKSGLSVAAMKTEAIRILDNCKSMGFNAVVFQVRPSGDALYKSSIFPWSEVLTGTQGRAPEGGFDPLKFWIDEAHARGLELHAWINPFRVARSSHDISKLAASNPARKNPALVVKHADGHMYLNPGLPEARKLVIDGVREIVTNYDVDGIHYDDYFYPSANFGDSAAYTAHGKGYSNIEDWRRDN